MQVIKSFTKLCKSLEQLESSKNGWQLRPNDSRYRSLRWTQIQGSAAYPFSNTHLLPDPTNVKIFLAIVGGSGLYLWVLKMAMARPKDCLPCLTATNSPSHGDDHARGWSAFNDWGRNRHLLRTAGIRAIWSGLGGRIWEGRGTRGSRVREAAAVESSQKLPQATGARNPSAGSLLEPLSGGRRGQSRQLSSHTWRRRHQPLEPRKCPRVPKP